MGNYRSVISNTREPLTVSEFERINLLLGVIQSAAAEIADLAGGRSGVRAPVIDRLLRLETASRRLRVDLEDVPRGS